MNKEIELIIQDNSEKQSPEFLEILSKLNDLRIKYIYVSESLSITETCDLAISAADGEYICMLGDDDGILQDLSIDVINISKKYKIDAVVVNAAQYYWPDTTHSVWKNLLTGKLFYQKYTFTAKIYSTANELKKTISCAGVTGMFNLPRVYHGFVRKKKLDELKEITGSYFPGPSPDMANSVGLVKVIDQVLYVDVPVIIAGHSKKSTGGLGGEKKHHGNLKNQLSLPKETFFNWSNLIPKFWSGPTIYAESLKEALRRTNNPLQSNINYAYLYAYCYVFNVSYYKETTISLLNHNKKYIVSLYYVLALIIYRFKNFIYNYFMFRVIKGNCIRSKDIVDSQNNLHNLIRTNYAFHKNKIDYIVE